ncbi:hypothetical protein R1flu_028415 [Riccia fluitans]|uniref:FAS1 domain-containing protein n=1 Tax=Riccia fluitans TaxID=41844 RepID=A0ABD1XLM0_9MARC
MGSVKAAPILLLLFLATVSAQTTPTFNVTTLLEGFPDFSVFNQLLTSTRVADEINSRRSITILALKNAVLSGFQAGTLDVSDVLRYHVLLQFFDIDQLKALDMVTPTNATTLLQTTGKMEGKAGELFVYNTPSAVLFGPTVVGFTSNATLITNITRVDYDISIVEIDHVLIPGGFATVAPASEPATAPASEPTPASGPAPASDTTPASEPAPASKSPAKAPTKPGQAPASGSAPGSEQAPSNGAVMVKGGVVAVFATFVAVLFM